MTVSLPVPRPASTLLTGALPERRRLGAEFYGEMARLHGDVAEFRLGTWSFVLLSHPRAIRHVLQEHPTRYSKGDLFDSLRFLLGDGLFFSEGAEWRAQRRTVRPSFHPTNLGRLVPLMRECLDEALPALDHAATHGASVDLYALMSRFALDVTCRSLFGNTLSSTTRARVGALVEELAELIDTRMFSVFQSLPMWVPLPFNLRILAVVRELDSIVLECIERRRTDPSPHTDILGTLLAARDPETGAGLSAVEIRDQVMTFFMAGYETTASALSWMLASLAEHPEWAERVRSESLACPPIDGMGALRRLPVTTSVFQETLRLYPPGWTFVRQSVCDDVVDGYEIPRGTDVLICPYALHRDPRFWSEPMRFDPERFPLTAEQRSAYIPFGAGPRACIGGQLSMLQGAVVSSVLMQRYRFTLAQKVEAAPLVTLRPDGGVQAFVERIRPGCRSARARR